MEVSCSRLSWTLSWCGSDHVIGQCSLVATASTTSLDRSGLSHFVWAIIFHLDCKRYVQVVLNIQVFCDQTEPDVAFSFVKVFIFP